MARKITVAMQKGGVGKTATAVNLAWGLAEAGYRTLLIDLDHQGSASLALGVNKDVAEYTSEEFMLAPDRAFAPVTLSPRLDLVPANQGFATVELVLVRDPVMGVHRLRRAVAQVEPRYDFILCDCAPTLGVVTLNAMLACPEVLVPVQLARIAVMGVRDVQRTVDTAAQVEPACRIAGFLPTFAHDAETESREAFTALCTLGGDRVLRAVIHRATAVALAMAEGRSVLTGNSARSRAASEYRALVVELHRADRAAEVAHV